LNPYPTASLDLGSSSYKWCNLYLSGSASIDTDITIGGKVVKKAGTQERGICGIGSNAGAIAENFYEGVNFKTTMTNILSSITLTPIASNNSSSPWIFSPEKEGFMFGVSALAAGDVYWWGYYDTVGN